MAKDQSKKKNKIIPIVLLAAGIAGGIGLYFNDKNTKDRLSQLENNQNQYITIQQANEKFVPAETYNSEQKVQDDRISALEEDCVTVKDQVEQNTARLDNHEERITSLEERVTIVEDFSKENRRLIEHYHPEDSTIDDTVTSYDPFTVPPKTDDPFIVDNFKRYEDDLKKLFPVQIDGRLDIADLIESVEYNNSHGTTQITLKPSLLDSYDIRQGIIYTNGTYQESQEDVIQNKMFFTGGEDRVTLDVAVILRNAQGQNFLAGTSTPVEYIFPKPNYIESTLTQNSIQVRTISTLADRLQIIGYDVFGAPTQIYNGKPAEITDDYKSIDLTFFPVFQEYEIQAISTTGTTLETEKLRR
ncbi:hypothetical protein JXM83_00690 [Candidatus Woesearchaeota archaeon]|nr:hypothetical protein [Candidatus Woesearchaeota archaeon]